MDVTFLLIRFLALLPALTLHEFAHAYSAYKFGDPTPKLQRRVSLNPLDHLDPIGTIPILFGWFGWAKPVMVNPYNFRQPARHMMLSTAFGPLSNIAQGVVWALIARVVLLMPFVTVRGNLIIAFVAAAAVINFSLAAFNLIPLGPLDGHEILRYFLPYGPKVKYHLFNERYGMAILFGLIILSLWGGVPLLGYILAPAWKLADLIAGVDLYYVIGLALS